MAKQPIVFFSLRDYHSFMHGLGIPFFLFFSVQPGAIFWYVTRGIDKTWNNTGGVGKYRVINAQVTIKKPEDEHPVTISHKPVDITGSPCNGNPVRNFEPETAVIPAVAGLPV